VTCNNRITGYTTAAVDGSADRVIPRQLLLSLEQTAAAAATATTAAAATRCRFDLITYCCFALLTPFSSLHDDVTPADRPSSLFNSPNGNGHARDCVDIK
jgi:hypothetical protein